jgi:hypothetical protein
LSRFAARFDFNPSAASDSSTMSTSTGSQVALAGSTRPTTSPGRRRGGRTRRGAAARAGEAAVNAAARAAADVVVKARRERDGDDRGMGLHHLRSGPQTDTGHGQT